MIVDAHLDIAWNALYNTRNLTLPVRDIRASETRSRGIAMTSLSSLGEAGVGVVFATLYATPATTWSDSLVGYHVGRPIPRYNTPQEAEEIALEMLDLYEAWAEAGQIRIIRDRVELEEHLRKFGDDRVPGFLILMEGADSIVSPDDLPLWFARGLRMISLAWGSTRYAGGTGSSAPLTDIGRELLTAMAEIGIVHDASHLSEEAFWEAVGLPHRGLCVSHGNPRALMLPPPGHRAGGPLNRHLSDAQIAEVARPHGVASRGVIGLALVNSLLEPRWGVDAAGRATEVRIGNQVAAHLHYLAAIAGWESLGIGSDVDSGFGRDETPLDLDSVADWPRIADPAPNAQQRSVLGENWLRFLRQTLPEPAAA
jgi:membrane dipeptidase